ncbi:MAG TPA: molybdopterin cofactor-binding domain-containing protein [Gemmatimonadaceae bacterium]|jgi:isoquinoline 1-oxidoreductase beta subunit|nr:molybdopterin cofactor-binding domain-containing protein [Gemmatimonadaceae bacterium]
MKPLRKSSPPAVDRREFIKVSALAGGGLLFGAYLRFGESVAYAESAPIAETFAPNVFISIAPNGAVSIIAPNSEMGQGIKTGLPMIVAEELDVAWEDVTIVQGDLNSAYGRQASVGSGSTVGNYTPLRRAGATARAMLVAAAAQTWGVPESECTTERSAVIHAASKRRARYGDLVAKAATLTPPENAPLKDPKDFKLLGTRVPGVDNQKVVTGAPLFGIDVKLPGMLFATYTKCPVFGGKPKSANLDEVKSRLGVRDAFILDGIETLTPGVAIVADTTWNAFSATDALKVQWDEGPVAAQSSAEMARQADQLAKATPPAPLPAGAKAVEAAYHYPFLAHATLEPQNCTAVFKNGVMEMWTPTQIPASGQGLVTRGLGLAPKDVIVHITRLGGGFGRRGSNEFSIEAAAIAKRLEGTPVKLMWKREHDFGHDNYRSNGWHYFTAGLDGGGKVVALHDAFVKMQGGPGDMSAGGFPFIAIPGSQVQSSKLPPGIPTGFWRAPGDNGNVWATQCFVDELAHAAGRDPVAFTLDLISAVPAPNPAAGGRGFDPAKMTTVLKLATEKAGWGSPRPRGEGLGFAITHTNNAYVAIVADVSVTRDGQLTVKKLTAAVDAGTIINLSAAEAQVQGAMIDGIGAAWFQKVTIEHGAAAQTNFDEYPMLRMNHAPKLVEVHFIKSVAPPTGLGEPGLPAAAPAVCNAIFAATGKRVRTLPIVDMDLKWA